MGLGKRLRHELVVAKGTTRKRHVTTLVPVVREDGDVRYLVRCSQQCAPGRTDWHEDAREAEVTARMLANRHSVGHNGSGARLIDHEAVHRAVYSRTESPC